MIIAISKKILNPDDYEERPQMQSCIVAKDKSMLSRYVVQCGGDMNDFITLQVGEK